MAAALDGLPITQVFTWATKPGDSEAVLILHTHGFELPADSVAGQAFGEPKRRDSVFGTTAQMASCLKVRQIAACVKKIEHLTNRSVATTG